MKNKFNRASLSFATTALLFAGATSLATPAFADGSNQRVARSLVCHVDDSTQEIIPLMLPPRALNAHTDDPATDAFEGHGDWPPMRFYADNDGDGFTIGGKVVPSIIACSNQGVYTATSVSSPADCNDLNAAVNPDALEVENNGIDDDCDPTTLDDPAPVSDCPAAQLSTIEASGTDWFPTTDNSGNCRAFSNASHPLSVFIFRVDGQGNLFAFDFAGEVNLTDGQARACARAVNCNNY